MPRFPVHDQQSAPTAAREALGAVSRLFGFVPNLIGVMATSPALVEAYLSLSAIFQKSSLSPVEQQVVLLATSRYHGCHYCMAAHSMGAEMAQVPAEVVEAIRSDQPIADAKLEALRSYVTQIVSRRGALGEQDVGALLAAGYEPAQALDVLVGVAQKVLSNFTNHIAETPLDSAFESKAWRPAVA